MAYDRQALAEFASREGAQVNAEFDEILAMFNPPKPLHVEALVLKRDRDHVVVWEDDECIIIMNK